jgi:hypothetical protein
LLPKHHKGQGVVTYENGKKKLLKIPICEIAQHPKNQQITLIF